MRARVNKQAQQPVLQASTSNYGVLNNRIHTLTNETASDKALKELNKLFQIN